MSAWEAAAAAAAAATFAAAAPGAAAFAPLPPADANVRSSPSQCLSPLKENLPGKTTRCAMGGNFKVGFRLRSAKACDGLLPAWRPALSSWGPEHSHTGRYSHGDGHYQPQRHWPAISRLNTEDTRDRMQQTGLSYHHFFPDQRLSRCWQPRPEQQAPAFDCRRHASVTTGDCVSYPWSLQLGGGTQGHWSAAMAAECGIQTLSLTLSPDVLCPVLRRLKTRMCRALPAQADGVTQALEEP